MNPVFEDSQIKLFDSNLQLPNGINIDISKVHKVDTVYKPSNFLMIIISIIAAVAICLMIFQTDRLQQLGHVLSIISICLAIVSKLIVEKYIILRLDDQSKYYVYKSSSYKKIREVRTLIEQISATN